MYYIISECLINLTGNNFISHSKPEPKSVKYVATSSEAYTNYNEH